MVFLMVSVLSWGCDLLGLARVVVVRVKKVVVMM